MLSSFWLNNIVYEIFYRVSTLLPQHLNLVIFLIGVIKAKRRDKKT